MRCRRSEWTENSQKLVTKFEENSITFHDDTVEFHRLEIKFVQSQIQRFHHPLETYSLSSNFKSTFWRENFPKNFSPFLRVIKVNLSATSVSSEMFNKFTPALCKSEIFRGKTMAFVVMARSRSPGRAPNLWHISTTSFLTYVRWAEFSVNFLGYIRPQNS